MSGKRIGFLALVMMGCTAGGDPGVAVEAHGAPPPPPRDVVGCWVTGGGQIEPDDSEYVGGAFGFNAMSMRDETYRGRLNFVSFEGDHFRGRTVEGIECFVVEGEEPDPPDADPVIAEWWGEGIWNGEVCDYLAHVEDYGEPGTDDVFELTVYCDGETFSAGDVIARGNIQIHPPNPGHPDLSGGDPM